MVFEQKKINIETLSEYLKQVRQDLGLSIEQVCQRTNIAPKFVKFLENGELTKLPPDVYVFGFLKQLASLYTIESDALIVQYKKERGILQNINKPQTSSILWNRNFFSKLVLTPKILSMLLAGVFIAATLGYLIWQVYAIDKAPFLEIVEPQDKQIIKDSFVNVSGKTDPGMNVAINGQDIFVSNDGSFKTQLGVTPGPKDLTVVARNRFSKETTRVVSIVAQSTATTSPSSNLQLRLDFSADVSLSFSIDGGDPQVVMFHDGDSKVLMGAQKIIISTTNAGATSVILNGQNLGPMGRSKEQLQNIPFFNETGSGIK